MMPTAAPARNPWLRLYLPIALQEPKTAAKEALLCAMLGVAAFNKAELSSADHAWYRRQGLEYSEKAMSLLESIMNQSSNTIEDVLDRQAMLAAALTLTTVEVSVLFWKLSLLSLLIIQTQVFSGAKQGKGYKYLLLARDIIQLTGGMSWWLSDTSNVTLFQIFRCLRIISYTSGWSSPEDILLEDGQDSIAGAPPPQPTEAVGPEDDSLTNESTGLCEYTLDISFGVSMKTLWCLNKTVSLSKIKSQFSDKQTWSPRDIDELNHLEDEVFDLMDDPDAFNGHPSLDMPSQQGIAEVVAKEIMMNHVWSFHYAVAIFFRRSLCDGGAVVRPLINRAGPQKRRPSGQYLVSKALEHLENIDALARGITIANTLWPGFIAAVEAMDLELRHRAIIWFARAKRHGIGNIEKSKHLVLETWRRVDRTCSHDDGKELTSELGHVDWREVMREMNMYIMLT